MSKATRTKLQHVRSAKGDKRRGLIVISGGTEKSQTVLPVTVVPVVSQTRLAEIQDLQSRIAFDKEMLSRKWSLLRHDILKGASIEKGPIRAWLENRLQFSRKPNRKKKIRTRLVVR